MICFIGTTLFMVRVRVRVTIRVRVDIRSFIFDIFGIFDISGIYDTFVIFDILIFLAFNIFGIFEILTLTIKPNPNTNLKQPSIKQIININFFIKFLKFWTFSIYVNVWKDQFYPLTLPIERIWDLI